MQYLAAQLEKNHSKFTKQGRCFGLIFSTFLNIGCFWDLHIEKSQFHILLIPVIGTKPSLTKPWTSLVSSVWWKGNLPVFLLPSGYAQAQQEQRTRLAAHGCPSLPCQLTQWAEVADLLRAGSGRAACGSSARQLLLNTGYFAAFFWDYFFVFPCY